MNMAGDCYQPDQEVQLSPLVIPVSFPVSSKKAAFDLATGQTVKTFTSTIIFCLHCVVLGSANQIGQFPQHYCHFHCTYWFSTV